MKAILIDDEERARINLSLLLKEFCPTIQIVAQCSNLAEGVKAIRREKPNIVFLDIEMPGHSGLELLDFFNANEIDFGIIFTTAYNEYAIKAFKLSAIDYLLKPINPEELIHSIELFQQQQHLQHIYALKHNLLGDENQKIAIPISGKVIFLDVNEILYIKGEGSYTQVFKKDNTNVLVSRNLKSFEELLSNNLKIKRVHKSYILNMNEIISISKSDGGYAEMSNGMSIPISGESYQDILDSFHFLKR